MKYTVARRDDVNKGHHDNRLASFEMNTKGVFFTRAFLSHVSASSKYKPSLTVAAVSGTDKEKGVKRNINFFCGIKDASSVFRQRSHYFCAFVACLADYRS